MKKIFPAIILISFSVLLLGQMVLAQEGPKECCILRSKVTVYGITCDSGTVAASDATAAASCPGGDHCADSASAWGMFCLLGTFNTAVNWIFIIFLGFAALFLIMGAFNFLSAGGDPAKFTTARTQVMYAAIGIGVALLARILPNAVKALLGV